MAAFRNMPEPQAGRRDGDDRLADVDDNPWLALPKARGARFLPPPGEDARTCGPGPFSMADPETVTKQLEIAGYAEIDFERIDAPVLVGTSPQDAVALQLALGPAGEVCARRASSRSPQRRRSRRR